MADDAFKQGQIEGALLRIRKERPAGDGGIVVDKDGIIEVLEAGQGAFEQLSKLKRALGPVRLGKLYDSMQIPLPPNWLDRSKEG